MLKVVILVSSLDPQRKGGLSGHVLNLANWLQRCEDVSVTLISFSKGASPTEPRTFRHILLTAKAWHKLIPLVPLIKVAFAVARERPDVIHVHHSALSYMLLYAFFLAPNATPKVVTVHSHPLQEGLIDGWLKHGSLKHRMMEWSDRRLTRYFDIVVTGSTKLRDEVVGCSTSNTSPDIRVILNGVDETIFSGEVTRDDISSLGVDVMPGGLTLLNAKGMKVFNGQEVLIRALVRVMAHIRDVRVLLAGGGPDLEKLKSLSTELGVADRVHFLGRVPNYLMPKVVSISDIVVVPSRRVGGVEEGSSLALLEGMASGKPVIASDLGGLSETIVNGETGVLVPENDPDQLAAGIIWLHEHPETASAMAKRARDYVLRERTWRIVARRYAAAYKSATEKKRGLY